MKDLIKELTSYNLFNYLLPGAVFSVLADRYTAYSFVQSDLFLAFFVYYFTGLAISRLGSLVIEPLARRFRLVQFAAYDDFVRCAKEDEKLELLSELNNSYRTFVSVFLSLGVLKVTEFALKKLAAPVWLAPSGLCLFLLVLFLLSYQKQTAYVTKRINEKVRSK